MPRNHSSTYRRCSWDARTTSSTVMGPLPAMARKRPVRVPTSAMPAVIAPAMSRNTWSIARRVFSLSMEASIVDSAPMKEPRPVTLEGHGVRLEPLAREHGDALACRAVGLRTDNFNFASQRAIEALGAKKDGVIRHHQPRRDGTVRDTVMYSVLASEWPDVKRHLELRLRKTGSDQHLRTER